MVLLGSLGFNTQPPEGGWMSSPSKTPDRSSFNTQPPEGGWKVGRQTDCLCKVSTHSRPKAAGTQINISYGGQNVSTHSRPKAAGGVFIIVSPNWRKFQHTAARRRLGCCIKLWKMLAVFQHTAARRRLAQSVASYSSGNSFNTQPPEGGWLAASRMASAMG